MNINIISLLIYIVGPLVLSMMAYIAHGVLARIQILEDKMQNTTTEPEVRQLIHDKYDPLAQDIRDIKDKLDKLFDMYLNQNKRSD